MTYLKQACVLRDSVFDAARRDTVLNLSHLVSGKIDASSFFDENYVTAGLRTLLVEAHRRLQGKSDQPLFKLTQAMGGGKTHSLITLGMLARHPEFRAGVVEGLPTAAELPPVRVVAFSGYDSDAPHGIWGEIARQLGREDVLKEYYSPLRAPGREAWTTLLRGEPTLILLDELPPYLDNARAISVGNSDLSHVTKTALTNLFEAVAESELGNVCVVLTDLVGTYAEASAQIATVLDTIQAQATRRALNLTPVQINTDEFFHILRKRLFKSLPSDAVIDEVAQAYASTIRDARNMDITAQSPEHFAQLVRSSYPFHPAIKDLYARFRENPGFQQTRALIRLMRIVAARLWTTGDADRKHLLAVHDLDLNDPETLSEVRQINPTLENAIAHDIAAGGQSIAERMDANLGGSDARDVCRLLLVSSLANVPNAIRGLTIPELVAYLCEPGRDLARLKGEVIEKLATAAWYLYGNRDGKLYFRDVENLNAKLESRANGYARDSAIKELRKQLEGLFKPQTHWCYARVQALPAIDEIRIEKDRILLVICEPFAGAPLNPELRKLWQDADYQNRVLFLTGPRATFDGLIVAARRLRAISEIKDEMAADASIPANDPQHRQADELLDRLTTQFLSAAKETFSTLHFPTARPNAEPELASADFTMRFDGNRYDGEKQVLEILREKLKFTDDIASDTFRKKVEARLFTVQQMPWSQILEKAAADPRWQWHKPDALSHLRDDCYHKGIWRPGGGDYVDRSPPPPKTTEVQIQERGRNDDTGIVSLKVVALNGDTVYAEVGAEATTASRKLDNGLLDTADMEVSFLAADSTGANPTGPTKLWRNKVTLKHRVFQGAGGERRLELRAAPGGDGLTTIRYTTNGANPENAGGTYDDPIEVPKGSPMVLAIAERNGVRSEVLSLPMQWGKDPDKAVIDPAKPAIWQREHRPSMTADSYALLDRARRFKAELRGVSVSLTGDQWVDTTMVNTLGVSADQVQGIVEALRKLPGTEKGQVAVTALSLRFETGQLLLDWLHDAREEAHPGEVRQ